MTITMQNLERLTLAEMQEFLAGSRSIGFANQGREQIYRLVGESRRKSRKSGTGYDFRGDFPSPPLPSLRS